MVGTIEALDLNHLRVFEKVASLASFSAAARALGLPKSNVSRSVARLEATLGTRLFQRTTRNVVLTATGEALKERCALVLADIDETVDYISGLAGAPRGQLKLSAGIGFGINVLADLLPAFLDRYPEVQVTLNLSTRLADLVSEGVDCAIRLGPLPDSALVATQLGVISRYPCAAPAYVARRGTPAEPADLASHDTIEMPSPDGRARPWIFNKGEKCLSINVQPRVFVDEALTIFRMVQNGAGVGIVAAYLCGPEIAAGRLVRLLPEWTCPPLPVSLVYPTRRELRPAVRAFADFVKEASLPGQGWRYDPLAADE